MSELSRYEQILKERLTNLPLPDEDLAWDKMAKLLEEDDEDIIPSTPVNKGCFIGALLFGLLALVAAWFFISFSKPDFKDKSVNEKINDARNNNTVITTASKKMENSINKKNNDAVKNERHFTDALNNNKDSMVEVVEAGKTTSLKTKQKLLVKQGSGEAEGININKENDLSKGVKPTDINASLKKVKSKGLQKKSNSRMRSVVSYPPDEDTTNSEEENSKSLLKQTADKDSLSNILHEKVIDSVNDKLKDVKKRETNLIVDTLQKMDDKKKTSVRKNLSFAAGIAVQQAVPLNGESSVPFNAYGRKGAVTDYIPSVYFRVYHQSKWFIQQEFRYGAPQYIKEYIYKTKVLDTNLVSPTTASYFLKKTYYHQLPFSINYFVNPNWSVGTGIVFNKFVSAISREDIRKTNGNPSTDSLISSLIITDKDYSIFVKNNFQWLIETQYRWKRFSIGFRYVRDIKPYVEFKNSSSGIIEKKRNYSANIFIRYELWHLKRNQ